MKVAKRTLAVLLLVLLMGRTVSAREWLSGSITVNFRWQGEAVAGGTLTLHRVGDSDYNLTEGFEDCEVELSEPYDADLAWELAEFAKNIPGQTKSVGADGTAVFEPLEPGLYLVVQREAAEGFQTISPFLVGIPMQVDGALVYHVDASPKASPVPKLPQTGQVNWPVPVMAAAGILLLLAGRRKRDA